MLPDEYAQLRIEAKYRSKKIDKYKDEILDWLTDFRDMSAAQVNDWFKERHYYRTFFKRLYKQFKKSI